jgi:hypothetical protein
MNERASGGGSLVPEKEYLNWLINFFLDGIELVGSIV